MIRIDAGPLASVGDLYMIGGAPHRVVAIEVSGSGVGALGMRRVAILETASTADMLTEVARVYGLVVTAEDEPRKRLDPRKVVVRDRYVRAGDTLELADGARLRVTRVEPSRMVVEVSGVRDQSVAQALGSHGTGTLVLDDEHCARLQGMADAEQVRRAA